MSEGFVLDETGVAIETKIAESLLDEEQLDAAVDRGIDWLDLNHPDWADRINLETFDITHTTHCVMGQVKGRSYYEAAKEAWGQRGNKVGETLGFNLPDTNDEGAPVRAAWKHLQQRWVREIRARQSSQVTA